MIELILCLVFAGVFSGGVITVVRKGLTSRKFHVNPELPAPEPRRMVLGPPRQLMLEAPRAEIPEDIRRELDESYEMSRNRWDEEFHTTLESLSSREVVSVRSNYTYDGDDLPEHTLLKDCTCKDCTNG